ncbi:MAG TPA: type II toxin-antitoxin system HicA family toxin [Methylomirabilota bacterium]|nr:type II toxin-antitoxin system HicA family toxin [Methylomirabilota bacterium]
MSKLPRDLSGQEVVRALRRLGFEVLRQHGSHIRMGKDNLRITVPDHSQVAPGTLKSILRQARLELDTFLAEL